VSPRYGVSREHLLLRHLLLLCLRGECWGVRELISSSFTPAQAGEASLV
jgi:hypothetical protein